MAIKKISEWIYTGLNSDVKPLSAKVSAKLYIEDADEVFFWDGNSWVAHSSHGALRVTTNDHLNTFSKVYTADGVVALFTPGVGNKIAIDSVHIETDSSAGSIALDFLTSTKPIARVWPSKNSQSSDAGMHLKGNADEVITLTSSGVIGGGGSAFLVIVNYVEH